MVKKGAKKSRFFVKKSAKKWQKNQKKIAFFRQKNGADKNPPRKQEGKMENGRMVKKEGPKSTQNRPKWQKWHFWAHVKNGHVFDKISKKCVFVIFRAKLLGAEEGSFKTWKNVKKTVIFGVLRCKKTSKIAKMSKGAPLPPPKNGHFWKKWHFLKKRKNGQKITNNSSGQISKNEKMSKNDKKSKKSRFLKKRRFWQKMTPHPKRGSILDPLKIIGLQKDCQKRRENAKKVSKKGSKNDPKKPQKPHFDPFLIPPFHDVMPKSPRKWQKSAKKGQKTSKKGQKSVIFGGSGFWTCKKWQKMNICVHRGKYPWYNMKKRVHFWNGVKKRSKMGQKRVQKWQKKVKKRRFWGYIPEMMIFEN